MSHMWNPYVSPWTIPTRPQFGASPINLDEQEHFGQHDEIPQAESDDYTRSHERPTNAVGAHHVWPLPMPWSGSHTLGSGQWPQWYPRQQPLLIDSYRSPHVFDGRHNFGFIPRPHPSNDHYANGDRSQASYTYGGRNSSGPGYSFSHEESLELLPEAGVESNVSRKEKNTRGNTVDIDKHRNRESSFHHPPIDFASRQIRLVRILPTEPGVPIKCKFALSMVDNKSVRYTALSYTWGSASSESDIERITLHKQDFWTRRNLWCFLRQVRDDPALRANWYWIDALCIDQAENGRDGSQEKNHQVNMMSQIYSNAHVVMTWLGEPAQEEHAALAALQSALHGRSSEPNHALVRHGLRCLGDSPYWSRIWIIQEMVLAKKARFRVGIYNFNWNSIYRMRLEAHESNTWQWQDIGWAMTNILDLRQDWHTGKPLDIVNGMHDFGTQKCSDPRDKIYGLLGLMVRKPCTADYSKSCKDLYVEVVLWALNQDLLRRPTHMVSNGIKAGDHLIQVPPCIHLRLWSKGLGLSAPERKKAQQELADHLGEEWPLVHPWKC